MVLLDVVGAGTTGEEDSHRDEIEYNLLLQERKYSFSQIAFTTVSGIYIVRVIIKQKSLHPAMCPLLRSMDSIGQSFQAIVAFALKVPKQY